ncbi:MAG: hypothetical protein CVT93_07980 [Bacteroidetes bacterium HGW-Bacteroidetes-10]|nr:MAG: hypothetical protein CVT93_07980 [Bacteroidetes bacterium HGW-Bacteroidetes-10]
MSRYILMAFVLIIAAGCVKDNFISYDRSALLSLTPTVNKNEATISHDESFINNFKIGIQVTNSEGTELYYSYTKNLSLSYGDKWNLSKPVCLTEIYAKIYAYYPFAESDESISGTGESAVVNLDIPKDQVMALQTDYMYASQSTFLPTGGGPIYYANPHVTLELNHALSLISFVIYKEDYIGAGELSNIEISDESTISGLTVNSAGTEKISMRLSDGKIINGNSSSEISVNSVENSITETVDPGLNEEQLKTMVNGYMYVVPSVFEERSNVQFELKIDNKIYTITHTGEGELTWAKGFQYIYKLRLTNTALTIMGIIITDWDVNYSGEIIIL